MARNTAKQRLPGTLIAIVILALAVAAVYAPVRDFPFLSYDDEDFIVNNPLLASGLSWGGLRGALTTVWFANWHPVAWVSHMVDIELVGMDAGAHHVVNVVYHVAGAAGLLVLLLEITGAFGPSLLAAAIWALHPLRVESVAWITERKDALSTLLFLLALLAWLRVRRRPGPGFPAAALALAALAAMAKPTTVVLPLCLLLLEAWPVGRLAAARLAGGRAEALRRLALGLAPFAVVAAGASTATWLAQRSYSAIHGLDAYPIGVRLANAAHSAVAYLRMTLWPSGLCFFYPHPGASLPMWKTAAATALLLAITAAVLYGFSRRPWLAVGWLWYLATLLPVIGIVQVGEQGMADRYTYLPSVGIAIILAGAGAELQRRSPVAALRLAPVAVALCAVLAVAARAQTGWWRDDRLLYDRALAVTTGNYMVLVNRGFLRERRGDPEGAVTDYLEALRIQPRYPEAYSNLASVSERLGRPQQAEVALQAGIRQMPGIASLHVDLGTLLLRRGRLGEAERHLRDALRIEPGTVRGRVNLAAVLAASGRAGEAKALLREVLRERPETAVAREALERLDARP